MRKIPYQPKLYLHGDDGSGYRTMNDEPLKELKFDSIQDAADYIKKYKDVSNHQFFGNTNFVYQYICDAFPGEIDFDLSQLGIWTLDIETTVEHHKYPDSHKVRVRLKE
jgi:hypothetical protein